MPCFVVVKFSSAWGFVQSHHVPAELRQMRQKQDQDKRDLVESQRTMSSIEAKAQRQYEADQRAAQESQKKRLGEWVSVHAASNLQACTTSVLRLHPSDAHINMALHCRQDLLQSTATEVYCVNLLQQHISKPLFQPLHQLHH